MNKDARRLQELSIFVHGILAGLHILGIAYNVAKRHPFQAAAHTSAAAFDIWAVTQHVRTLQDAPQ